MLWWPACALVATLLPRAGLPLATPALHSLLLASGEAAETTPGPPVGIPPPTLGLCSPSLASLRAVAGP
jgi:hypothetical protein